MIIAGDHVFQGPNPAGVVDALREMEASGATIVQGNTDVAVADFDYAAAFPWATDGVPDTFRAAAEWANDALATSGSAGCAASRPSAASCSTTRWSSPATPRRARRPRASTPSSTRRSSSSGSRGPTPGSSAAATPTCPEIRDLGWKLIVNDGSAGLVFDGDPTASWALVEIDGTEIRAEIRRAEFDTMAVANAISARGLPGDVYRAATVRTGKLVR